MGCYTRRFALSFAIACLAWSYATPAQALKFRPFISELRPAGSAATRVYRVENESADPVAVQITVSARSIDEKGKDILTDADDLFLVYPEQLILKPQSTQSVRIQWLGPADIKAEQAFRIVVEQLPVELDKDAAREKKGQMRLLLRYVGAMYVVPKGASSDIVVEKAEKSKSPVGRDLTVTVKNKGTAHAVLYKPKLLLKTFDRKTETSAVELTGDNIGTISGANILAGGRRVFRLPWPKALDDKRIEAKLEFEPL